MSIAFMIVTFLFILVSAVMILIILVQRPQGGGLAGAFGGAGGGSTDTVFGGRVGDALTVMTVAAFVAYLGLAIGLNLIPIRPVNAAITTDTPVITSTPTTDTPSGTGAVTNAPANTQPAQPVDVNVTPVEADPNIAPPSDAPATSDGE